MLTGTEAWRAGDRARALEQAFLELDQRMALPEHRGELAELAGAQADEDMQCGAPAPARPAQRALSQRGLSLCGVAGGVRTARRLVPNPVGCLEVVSMSRRDSVLSRYCNTMLLPPVLRDALQSGLRPSMLPIMVPVTGI